MEPRLNGLRNFMRVDSIDEVGESAIIRGETNQYKIEFHVGQYDFIENIQGGYIHTMTIKSLTSRKEYVFYKGSWGNAPRDIVNLGTKIAQTFSDLNFGDEYNRLIRRRRR